MGVDESTVPAGAITLNDTTYIYSMQVNHWGSNSQGTHAHGVLFEQHPDGTFVGLIDWPVDNLFVNTAPIAAKLPDGTPAIFMATTAQYRHSPIYLAYVIPSAIGDASSYRFLTGYDENGVPVWSSDMAEAEPLPGLARVWVGELSFLYEPFLNNYLLMFKDYSKTDSFSLYSSSAPYGPFMGPLSFYPCGTSSNRPDWMESGWGGCYGGYMLPGNFGPDGAELHFVVSLWDPYTTIIMTMRLSPASTNQTTTQNSAQSSPSAAAASTSPVNFPVALALQLSAAVLCCGAGVILARRYLSKTTNLYWKKLADDMG